MDKNKDKLLKAWTLTRKAFAHHYGCPQPINWGYPVFMCAIGIALTFALKSVFTQISMFFSTTSLFGAAILVPFLVLVALIVPSVLLGERVNVKLSGKFTGIGPLFTSLFTGAPIYLIFVALHNFTCWASLYFFGKITFPAFYFNRGGEDVASTILYILVRVIIPALGVAYFFFGFMWSRFKSTDKKLAYPIIAVFLAVFAMVPTDFLGILVVGIWLCFLRDRSGNIWGPFVCMLGAFITQIFMVNTVGSIDITTVQTYSDIDITVFYSSLPALIIGIILVFCFMKLLDDFYFSYNDSVFATKGETSYKQTLDESTPSVSKGINTALVSAIIVFLVLWIMIFNGVQL